MESRIMTLPNELWDSRAICACRQVAVSGLVVDTMVLDVPTLVPMVLVGIQRIFNYMRFPILMCLTIIFCCLVCLPPWYVQLRGTARNAPCMSSCMNALCHFSTTQQLTPDLRYHNTSFSRPPPAAHQKGHGLALYFSTMSQCRRRQHQMSTYESECG
jgi:hypothetical protein